MKNIRVSKICIMLIAVFAVHFLFAQDAPPPVAPAYEAPTKTKKKKRGTEPVAPPAVVIENTDARAAPPETENEEADTSSALAFWEDETPTETAFKQQFDLFILWKFIDNYTEDNRTEINREGESIFYPTERTLPGAIDKYIEVKNKQGEFKFIFYRGTNQSEAETKYREIAGIATKVMDKDFIQVERNYCSECTGLVYGYSQKGSLAAPSYWVQLVTKPNSLYEVQIIGPVNLAPEYLKEVAKPVAVASTTKSTATEPSASTDVNKLLKDMEDQKETHRKKVAEAFAKSLPNTIQEDFCSIVQRVIKQFPNDFAGWKLEERPQRMKFFAGEFFSKYMIQGSVDALVHEDKMAALMYEEKRRVKAMQYSWMSTLFNGKSEFSKVLALYQSYTAQMDACAISCCMFVKKKERLDIAEGQLTRWTVSSLQPGANDKYKDMIIELRFSYDAYDGIWNLHFWVQQQ